MGFIYKIYTDFNDKVYIGQTHRTIEDRWKEHLKDYKSPQRLGSYLYRSMQAHGIEHYNITEIEEVPDEALNEREIYWIDYYDSYNNGYNNTKGGEGGQTLPTYEHRKINGTPILQYTLDGTFIKEYISSGQAEEETGTQQDEINRCCTRARNAYSANGYIWKRVNDDTPIEVWVEANKHKLGKRAVVQYTLDGIYINEYQSIAEANHQCGFPLTSRQICMCCTGKRKSAYGYCWEYKNPEKQN